MKPVNVLLFILLSMASLALASYLLPKITIKGKEWVSLPDFTDKLMEKPDSTAYFAELKKAEESKTLVQRKQEILKKPSRSSADTLVLLQVEAMESPARFYFANEDRGPMD